MVDKIVGKLSQVEFVTPDKGKRNTFCLKAEFFVSCSKQVPSTELALDYIKSLARGVKKHIGLYGISSYNTTDEFDKERGYYHAYSVHIVILSKADMKKIISFVNRLKRGHKG